MRPITLLIATSLFAMTAHAIDTEDPFLWLEEVEGEKALEWARAQNAESLGELEKLPEYEPLFEKNLAVYDSQERIAYPGIRGEYVYNFWRDASNERGLWRRTPTAKYSQENPEWEVLIDVDKLAEAEDENWVWSDVNCLPPEYERCIVSLSRGGADANVVREFDIPSRSFVEDGFRLEESRNYAYHLDRDTVFFGASDSEETRTESGYPRQVKVWQRGQAISEVTTLYEGEFKDIGIFSTVVHTPEKDYSLVVNSPTFFSQQYFLNRDGQVKRVPIPDDAQLETIFRNQLLVSLKSDWEYGDETWPQGALISVDLDELMNGEGKVRAVVMPNERSAIDEVQRTRDLVLVNRMSDVRSNLSAFSLVDGAWKERKLEAPSMGQINITTTSEDSNYYFFTYTDFLTPTSLYEAEGVSTPESVKSLPEFFDASPYVVSQHFVESKDGTRVPYFLVSRKNLELNGKNPTLIYAYGGFEVSMNPSYSATIGMDWLDAGGVYALANIRGGGEYGPAWHKQAQRENRQKSYDDFYAVAEDLIERKVTTPRHLGIRGGSGGGLLVGMLFTQRPELFHAVVCQVPLLDMWRYDKLLAGASWVEEYGDPDISEDWAFLQNYSPYHNLDADKDYPRVFFTTSTRDDRVHPGHARKMVAKMNAMEKPNLYYENIEGGHGGAANNRQAAKVNALIYTYLINELR